MTSSNQPLQLEGAMLAGGFLFMSVLFWHKWPRKQGPVVVSMWVVGLFNQVVYWHLFSFNDPLVV